jgi:hypothetical protein
MSLYRKYSRKLGLHKSGSSFPFISGDTYKALCDLHYDGDNNQISREIESLSKASHTKLFIPVPLIRNFLRWVNSSDYDFLTFDLFIHNGDSLPGMDELASLSGRFRRVYCVNWIGKSTNIQPIPIGLENRKLHTNGVPRDFTKLINSGLPSTESRKEQILVSFSVSTNVTERSNALNNAEQFSEINLRHFQGSVSDYHQELLNSRFVLSPPGNGFDCHRTWEAIYLGAIPIVKEKYWPFSHLDLPVVVVQEWSELSRIHEFAPPHQISVEALAGLFLEF